MIGLYRFIASLIDGIAEEAEEMNGLIGTVYLLAFFGMVISLAKLGIGGSFIWGFLFLFCAITVLIIGIVTGIF